MADALKAHIAQCPEHPMAAIIKSLRAASHASRSYQYGNASPDLAEEIANDADATIAKVKP
jgi:hypothetical protein